MTHQPETSARVQEPSLTLRAGIGGEIQHEPEASAKLLPQPGGFEDRVRALHCTSPTAAATLSALHATLATLPHLPDSRGTPCAFCVFGGGESDSLR